MRAVLDADFVVLDATTPPREVFETRRAPCRPGGPRGPAAGRLVGVPTRVGALRSGIYSPPSTRPAPAGVAAAVGINGDVVTRATELAAAGADVLVIDTAHGHQEKMISALRAVAGAGLDVPLVAGNVVSAGATRDPWKRARTSSKPVSDRVPCAPRMVTGVGAHNSRRSWNIAAAARELGAHRLGRRRVRHPRDVALAIAAGASNVMIGSWFAGTLRGARELLVDEHGPYKESFGMASSGRSRHARLTTTRYTARKSLFEEGCQFADPRRPAATQRGDLVDQICSGVPLDGDLHRGTVATGAPRDKGGARIQSAAGFAEGRPLPGGGDRPWSGLT